MPAGAFIKSGVISIEENGTYKIEVNGFVCIKNETSWDGYVAYFCSKNQLIQLSEPPYNKAYNLSMAGGILSITNTYAGTTIRVHIVYSLF